LGVLAAPRTWWRTAGRFVVSLTTVTQGAAGRGWNSIGRPPDGYFEARPRTNRCVPPLVMPAVRGSNSPTVGRSPTSRIDRWPVHRELPAGTATCQRSKASSMSRGSQSPTRVGISRSHAWNSGKSRCHERRRAVSRATLGHILCIISMTPPDLRGPHLMSEREPPEKQTVKHTDELLRKSRRLIDELEFILKKLDRSPPKPKHKHGKPKANGKDSARSD
jgi:hypothetical protein